MSGGMRIDPKELPLRHQEQLAAAILAQITKAPPVEVREEKTVIYKRPVKRLVFISDRAADRYRILRKQAQVGQITGFRLHKNEEGIITHFTYAYTRMEVY